jgi:CRP-like cAMP-binding protein
VTARPDLVGLLASATLFQTLSETERVAVAARFREVRFTKGQELFARGEPGDALLVVGDGRVRLSVATAAGGELSVRHATAGDLLGEIAALDGGPRTADAVALTPVLAFRLDRRELRELLAASPTLARAAIDLLCARLRHTTDQLEGVALHSIEVRLARFLLAQLAEKPGEAAGRKRIPVELGFSQTELAQLIGASRPKVNMALGELEAAGALKRTSDRIFCDVERLGLVARAAD